MKLLDLLFNLIFAGVYLIGWVFIIVGLADKDWIRFNADGSLPAEGKDFECKAGLWETCCPADKWNDPDDSLLDGNRECRQNVFDPDHNDDDGGEGSGDELLRNFVERNIVDKVEMWSIRAFMVIASAMPLFAVIAALCGNRFCGYVQMVVAGFFGFFSVWTFVIYCAHKVNLVVDENGYNKLADPLQLGITFYLACVGVGIIWMMTLLECLICSQKYRETVHYHSPATVAPSHTTDSHSETSSIVSVQTDKQHTNKYTIE